MHGLREDMCRVLGVVVLFAEIDPVDVKMGNEIK